MTMRLCVSIRRGALIPTQEEEGDGAWHGRLILYWIKIEAQDQALGADSQEFCQWTVKSWSLGDPSRKIIQGKKLVGNIWLRQTKQIYNLFQDLWNRFVILEGG